MRFVSSIFVHASRELAREPPLCTLSTPATDAAGKQSALMNSLSSVRQGVPHVPTSPAATSSRVQANDAAHWEGAQMRTPQKPGRVTEAFFI